MDDDGPFTRAQARSRGWTDRQIDRRLKTGSLVAARRGVLHRPGTDDRSHDLPLDVRAAMLASPGRELVISHASAARVYGLPRPLGGWPSPQFTATSGPTRHRSDHWIRVASLLPEETRAAADALATSPARTLADCLRTLPGRDGLAMVDAALHRDLVSEAELLHALQQQAGWPKITLARRVLTLADGRRESPLESWSAWAFAHSGVPAPQWQVKILDAEGQFIARADAWWAGVVGEADGRAKYLLDEGRREPGAAVFQNLEAERRREERLREVGIEVVRWGAADILDKVAAARLARRIEAAICLARESNRFRGILAPT